MVLCVLSSVMCVISGVWLFYLTEGVSVSCRYDVKGCEVGRWANPSPKDEQPITVLKDMNFEGQHINLGKRKRRKRRRRWKRRA